MYSIFQVQNTNDNGSLVTYSLTVVQLIISLCIPVVMQCPYFSWLYLAMLRYHVISSSRRKYHFFLPQRTTTIEGVGEAASAVPTEVTSTPRNIDHMFVPSFA